MENNRTIVKEEINYCILNTETNEYLYSYLAYGLDKESIIRLNKPSYGTDVNKIRLFLDKDFAEEIIQGLTKYEKGSYRLVKATRTTILEFDDEIANGQVISAEPCEDAISRARVLSMAIFKQYNARQIGNIGNLTQNEIIKDWDDMIDFVETLPPVMPTPKTGHWIDIRNSNGTVIAVRCSNCEKSPKHAIKSDCCPNCGAKMKSSGGKE